MCDAHNTMNVDSLITHIYTSSACLCRVGLGQVSQQISKIETSNFTYMIPVFGL